MESTPPNLTATQTVKPQSAPPEALTSAKSQATTASTSNTAALPKVPAVITQTEEIIGTAKQKMLEHLNQAGIQSKQLYLNLAKSLDTKNNLLTGEFKFITDKNLMPGQHLILLLKNTSQPLSNRVVNYSIPTMDKTTQLNQLIRSWLPLNLPSKQMLQILSQILQSKALNQTTGDQAQGATNLGKTATQTLEHFMRLTQAIQKGYANFRHSTSSPQKSNANNQGSHPNTTEKTLTPALLNTHKNVLAQRNGFSNTTEPSIKAPLNQRLQSSPLEFHRAQIKLLENLLLENIAEFTVKNPADTKFLKNLTKWLKLEKLAFPSTQILNPTNSQAPSSSMSTHSLTPLHQVLVNHWQAYRSANQFLTQQNSPNAKGLQSFLNPIELDASKHQNNLKYWLDNASAILARAIVGSLSRNYLNWAQARNDTDEDQNNRILFLELPMVTEKVVTEKVTEKRIEEVTLAIERKKLKKKPTSANVSWIIHLGFSLAHLGKVYIDLIFHEPNTAEMNIWSNYSLTVWYIEEEKNALFDHYQRMGIDLKKISIHKGERKPPEYMKNTNLINIET